MTETEFAVYRWENEAMEFERRLFVKHEIGEAMTRERVREAVAAEVHDFKPAKYRVVPVELWVDIEVIGEVVLS